MKKKIVFPLLAIVISILIAFIIAEIALRIVYRDYQIKGDYWGIGAFTAHEKAGFTHKPGYEGFVYRKNAFRSFVKINDRGLRQDDLSDQLNHPEKLLILGDSFAFGLGIAEEDTFPNLIKNDLNPSGIGVINGAQSGYSIAQSFFFGKELISEFDPSMVVLSFFAENDFRDDYLEKYKKVEIRFGSRLRRNRNVKCWFIDLFRTHSYTYLLVRKYFNQIRNRKKRINFRSAARISKHEVTQFSFSYILKLKELCRRKNILFCVMTIPPKKGSTAFDRLLTEFLHREKIPSLDLQNAGFHKTDFLKKDGHWNEKGHAKAALSLSEFIRNLSEHRRDRWISGLPVHLNRFPAI